MNVVVPELKELTLMLTRQCNLRCTYCYVPKSDEPMMCEEVVRRAIDFFADHACPGADLTLAFFGGEPLLASDRLALAMGGFRQRLGDSHRLRIAIPTNLTLLDSASLALCRETGVELWVGTDGFGGQGQRLFPSGRDSAPDVRSRLRELIGSAPPPRITARMTLTPENVGELSRAVRDFTALGIRRISHLPALDVPWDDRSIDAWGEEHLRLGTWMRGTRSAGLPLPDLPSWKAIADRLTSRAGVVLCGAGTRACAVGLDGRIYPCHRFIVAPGGEAYVLGDLTRGTLSEENWARFAALRPESQRPEAGTCADCPAADGCTHFCPAHGHLALGRLDGVPGVACQLMRAQVDAVRQSISVSPSRRRSHGSARIAATILLSAAAATACGGQLDPGGSDGDAAQDGATDARGSPDARPDSSVIIIPDAGAPDAAVDANIDQDNWWQGCIG
jgi:uncharacterized protein